MSARQIVTPAEMRVFRYKARKEPGRYRFAVDVPHDLGRSRESTNPLSIAKRAERLTAMGYLVVTAVTDLHAADNPEHERYMRQATVAPILDAFEAAGFRPPEFLLRDDPDAPEDVRPAAFAESFAAMPRAEQLAFIRRASNAERDYRRAARAAHEARQQGDKSVTVTSQDGPTRNAQARVREDGGAS